VRVHGGRIFPVAIIDRLVNPAMPIPSASTAVHGITDQMVTNAPPFAAVWPSLEPLMRGAVIVGHNIGFDLAMLERECALLDQPFVPPPTLDTLLLAGLLLPDIGELNLDNVAATLGVDIHGRHTALGDALVTAEIYVRMIPLLQANGIETYAQAYAYTRRATHLLARQRAMGW
jgi:DNA polymerase-3 subunit epsilon